MSQRTLFPLPTPEAVRPLPATRPEEARVLRPQRLQVEWGPRDLEHAVPEDHGARAIWDVLGKLDLTMFYGSIKAVLDRPGRPTTDPRVLLAVWLLATVDGVGSARQLARLCAEHDAYRWLCGGVPINYHMLADFRVVHQAALDDLMSQILASLTAAGAVRLQRVAHDGMRVRASAGTASFRRKDKLASFVAEAQLQVQRLAELREHPDPGVTRRQEAARERAARERQARVERALAYLPQAQAAKETQQKRYAKAERAKITQPRASTTDPEARVMKMGDGGFRPAYNVQLATDTERGIIVGVAVTASGSDVGQAVPMVEQVVGRAGRLPEAYLMDGGFAAREDITRLEEQGIRVYAPVRLPKSKPEAERYEPRYGDTPQVVAWRKRMATEEAKTVYRQRAATAEWSNAQVKQHGLTRFTVRGLAKVMTVVLLVAVAHNLLRWISLAA